MIDVLLAAPSIEGEEELVASAPAAGVRIVRRCIDAVDVLAAVAAYPDAIPIISASLPRMVSATVDRLGARVVGLAEDEEDADRLTALGVLRIVRSTQAPVWPALVAPATFVTTPLGQENVTSAESLVSSESIASTGMAIVPASAPGLIAVWGPPGAPGRTTIAVGLADALARRSFRVCLVDADTYAPSIDIALGISGGGIATATVRAESASGSVSSSCWIDVSSTLSVLPGLGPSQSWRDLRPSRLVALWDLVRGEFDVVVVDVGSCIEDDDAASPWATRRNAAAVTALQMADHIVAVADSSPAGAARIARGWPQLMDITAAHQPVLVQNRASRKAGDWQATVSELGVSATVVSIPHDPRSVTSCWAHAATLSERAPRSPVTRAMRKLASVVVPD
jgi:Mrp family chromosome partitioning ATPase